MFSKQEYGNRLTMVPVALKPGASTEYKVATWFTTPSNGKHTVFIAIPGSTCDHGYWDFPYKPERYSFVEAMRGNGYSVLAIDRMGSGACPKPSGDLTTMDVQNYVVHQLVQGLRKGEFGGIHYEKVVLIGHSLGSCIAIQESAKYNDIDGIIVTGLLHNERFSGTGWTTFFKSVHATSEDPAFAGKDFQSNSFTTNQVGRSVCFNFAQIEPEVVAREEATKTTTSIGEMSDITAFTDTKKLKVPVLIAIGEFDAFFCNPPDGLTHSKLAEKEGPYYSTETNLEIFILPLSGHDMNLHLNASEWFRTAVDWTKRKID